MAIQLSASYLRRSFQLLARLSPVELSRQEAFDRAANIIYEWARGKFARIFRAMPERKATFDAQKDGNELGVLYDDGEGRFILRCAHPDVHVPGRMWLTDAELRRDGEGCIFALRLSVTSLHSCTEKVPFSCPGFVRHIARKIGLSDGIPVTDAPHTLSTRDEVEAFTAFLEAPGRRMPVVLVTPCSRPEDGPHGGSMLDADQMARDLLGVAHVFTLTREANELLTEAIDRTWSAFNGAVRTYYPGLSFENSDPYQHPMLTQRSIRLRDTVATDDPQLCMHEIEEYVRSYVLAQRINWEAWGVDFYQTAYQALLTAQRAARHQSQEEMIASYEEQLHQLKAQNDESLSLADSYAQDCELYQAQADQLRQKLGQLKGQIEVLRYQLQQATGGGEQTIPTDGKYTDIPQWIESHFSDRLTLHPRGARSLKNAVYESPELVYRCLMLLANEYYAYRTGGMTYDQFTEAMLAVDAGLTERGAITDIAAGMEGEMYYVQYHGRSEKLERHLAKGSSKDRRYCLRIYFFWDDRDQTVVIGDLPHHLNNSKT